MAPLSRRALLGGLGAGALLGPAWLRGALAQSGTAQRNLVVVWANGGWDTTFVLDPKLHTDAIDGPEQDGPGEDTHTYGDSLTVGVNTQRRPQVHAFFERWGERCCIVNGISTGSVAHDPSRLRVLTGSGGLGRADVSVIAGSVHRAGRPLGSIDLSGFSLAGPLGATAGRVGATSQLKGLIGTDAFTAPADLGRDYPLFRPDSDDRTAIQQILEARVERLRAARGGAPTNDQKLDDFVESLLRAERLLADGASTLDQLTLGRAPGFFSSLYLADQLLSRGVCSSVFVDTQSRWDTHVGNVAQHDLHENLFEGLQILADQLDASGRLDDTVVLVLSEMTRTPRINEEGGKDHWPYTSALLFGAGVKGGHSFGRTNDLLEGEPIDYASGQATSKGWPLTYESFAASVLALLDVDPGPWFGDIPTFTAWRA